MRELGFFFFLRMAVAISSSCGGSVSVASAKWGAKRTPLGSAPEGSLVSCQQLYRALHYVAGANSLGQIRLRLGVVWLSGHGGVLLDYLQW